jgi:uncharacterized protein (DUF427 family)
VAFCIAAKAHLRSNLAKGIAMTNAHRVDIEPNPHRLRVIHSGITLADTSRGFTLKETGLQDVFYFPREDVNMTRFSRSDTTTHCPYKGDASYFHLRTEDGEVIQNVAWSYESPYEAAAAIKDCLAFFSERVDRIDQTS